MNCGTLLYITIGLMILILIETLCLATATVNLINLRDQLTSCERSYGATNPSAGVLERR